MTKLNSLLMLGVGLLISSALSAQITVNSPQARNLVLEDFTGIKCGYCPDGHYRAEQIELAHPNRVVQIMVHQGSFSVPSAGQPDFRTSFGDPLASNAAVGGYPEGTVNRQLFTDIDNNLAMGRASWAQASENIFPELSPVNVGFTSTFDTTSRLLTVNVEIYYTGNSDVSTNFVHVALLQNNIVGWQTDYGTYPNGNTNNYIHNHVLRHYLTGQWGDTIYTTTAGTVFSKTYTYTVPASYIGIPCVASNCELAVFVTKTKNDIYTGSVAAFGETNDGETSLYIGSFIPPVADVLAGADGLVTSFAFQAASLLPGTEAFYFELTSSGAPANWTAGFSVDGTNYTSNATVNVTNGTPADITIDVTPGSSPGVVRYTLTMSSVSNPGASEKIIDVYVISGVTDLIVNGSGAFGDGNTYDWTGLYVMGLDFAGNTSYAIMGGSTMQKAASTGALAGVDHIYYNVGWTFPSFTDDEATALMDFMDGGGNVMICGQDIGWDINDASGYGTPVTENLFDNYLHAVYTADGTSANNSLNPVAADPIFGTVGISPVVDAYAGNIYPDQNNPVAPATTAFYYGTTTTKSAAIRYFNNDYKMVYLGVGIEMLSNTTVRDNIMKQTHDWFHGLISNTEMASASSVMVYPNPASNYIMLDGFAKSTEGMTVSVSDLTGRTVIELQNVENGKAINVSGLTSGLYLISISDGKETVVRKIQIQ
jgi:hypothetical protein